MELGEMKVLTNAQIYKDHLVSVETLEHSMKLDECLRCVGGVLSKIQKVQNSTNSAYKLHGGKTATKRQANDETEEKMTNLGMLLASNSLKCSNTLQKQLDLMVQREMSTACIELFSAICCLEPTKNMFDNALVELMQDVWHNREEDIDVGQLLPERMAHRLDPRLSACTGECSRGVVNLPQCSEDVCQVAEWAIGVRVISDVCGSDVTLGAGAILAASNEQLFWVVANVHRKDRVASSRNTVATNNLDAVNASLNERLEYHRETCMKEVCRHATMGCLVCDVFETRGREVCKKDLPAVRWFVADILWKIPYRQVDWVGCLATKQCELGFVRGYDDRYDHRARFLLLKLLLYI